MVHRYEQLPAAFAFASSARVHAPQHELLVGQAIECLTIQTKSNAPPQDIHFDGTREISRAIPTDNVVLVSDVLEHTPRLVASTGIEAAAQGRDQLGSVRHCVTVSYLPHNEG
jgi:hypothetical protein